MRKKICAISILVVALLLLLSLWQLKANNNNDNNQPLKDNGYTQNNTRLPSNNITEVVYDSSFSFDQGTELLNKEVTQYQLLFHNDTEIQINMELSYTMTSPGDVAYLVFLSNGTDEISLHVCDEGFGNVLDATGVRREWSLGGLKGNRSDSQSYSNVRDISRNESLYLTVAVWNSQKEAIAVHIDADKPCIQAKRIIRNGNVSLFSASHGDFNKLSVHKYLGLKLPFVNLGGSVFFLKKTFNMQNGGIVCANMWNQRFGYMDIIGEGYNMMNFNSLNSSVVTTGNPQPSTPEPWTIDAWGISVSKKASFIVFAVDVNPHSDWYRKDDNNRGQNQAIHTAIKDVKTGLNVAVYTIVNGTIKVGLLTCSVVLWLMKAGLAILQKIFSKIPGIVNFVLSILKFIIKILIKILKL